MRKKFSLIYYPENSQNFQQNYPNTFVQSGTIPVTPMGMGYVLPTTSMTTQHTMNPGNTPYVQTSPHTMMPNPVMMNPQQQQRPVNTPIMNPGNTPIMHTGNTPNQQPIMSNYPPMTSYATTTPMNPGNTPNQAPPAYNQYSAPIGNTTAVPQR